jgi:hypothetical protein
MYCLADRNGRLAEWEQGGQRAPLCFDSKAEAIEWKKRVAPNAANKPKIITNLPVPHWVYAGGQYALRAGLTAAPIIYKALTPEQEAKARETWASVGKFLYSKYGQWEAVFQKGHDPDRGLGVYLDIQRALERWQKDHPQATEAKTRDAVAGLMIHSMGSTRTVASDY